MTRFKKAVSVALAVLMAVSLCSGAIAAEYDNTLADDVSAALLRLAETGEYLAERDAGEIGALNDFENKIMGQIALPPEGTYVPGELLVKQRDDGLYLMDDTLADVVVGCEELFSVDMADESDGLSLNGSETATWSCYNLAEGVDVLAAWSLFAQQENVLCVQPNYTYTLDDPELDESYEAAEEPEAELMAAVTGANPAKAYQNWLVLMNAESGWSALTTGKAPGVKADGTEIVVAVVDSGVDLDHPDLAANIVAGYDFVGKDNEPDDVNGHGTHVAGIIAAADNAVGTVGVAYGAKIMPVRVMDENGSGSTSDIAAGINYATTNNANIINLSLGGSGVNYAKEDAINKAREAGIFVVAAAGNSMYPTAYDGSLYYGTYISPANNVGAFSVMAMSAEADSNGDWLSCFSNYDSDIGEGAEYEIMAPGSGILSTTINGEYGYRNGTSMACPTVAGAAAVLMGMGCNADRTWEILANSGEVLRGKTSRRNDGTHYGYHTLDLGAAVAAGNSGTTYSEYQARLSASVFPSCESITLDGGAVTTSFFDNTGFALRYDGKIQSKINLAVSNYGAAASDIAINGTIGGKSITTQPLTSLGAGRLTNVEISCPVGAELTADGEQMKLAVELTVGALTVNALIPVLDVVTPTDGDPTAEGCQLTESLTLAPSGGVPKMLIVTKNMTVKSDAALSTQDTVVYTAPGVKIEAENGASISFNSGSELFGLPFALSAEYGASVTVSGANIYNPMIAGVSSISNSRFFAVVSPETLNIIGKQYEVKAADISYCGFNDINQIMVIECTDFQHNMVNESDLVVYANKIRYNSFIENYFLYAITPDSDGTSVGFFENCVVGFAKICPSDTYLETYSVVKNVYVQQGDDKLYYKESGSTFVESMESCNFAAQCPAFVTDAKLSLYSPLANDAKLLRYELIYTFSTPLAQESNAEQWRSFRHYTNDSMDTRYTVGKRVAANQYAIYGETELASPVQSLVSGIGSFYSTADSAQNFKATAMSIQHFWDKPLTFYQPVAFSGTYYPKTEAKSQFNQLWCNMGGFPVTSHTIALYRKVDNGNYQQVGENDFETDREFVVYNDSSITNGHKYTYALTVLDKTSGAETGYINTWSYSVGGDTASTKLSASVSTATAGVTDIDFLLSGVKHFECMEFDVDVSGITIDPEQASEAIFFSDEVVEESRNNITVTASDSDTLHVKIGTGFYPVNLSSGKLISFKISDSLVADAASQAAAVTISNIKFDNADSAITGCSAAGIFKQNSENTGAFKAAYTADLKDFDICCADKSGVTAFAAIYDASNKMLKTSRLVAANNAAGNENLTSGRSDVSGLKIFWLNDSQKPVCKAAEFTVLPVS